MSLTETEEVFGGVHEDALNDLVRAFFGARPRYVTYGSPAFVGATSVNATQMDPIPFPFVPGGIDWAVTFSPPVIDLHPETPPAPPPEITLGPGQFTLHTGVQMCIACVFTRSWRRRADAGQDTSPPRRRAARDATCFKLEVHTLGHLELVTSTTGAPAVRLRLDAVEIVDIAPNDVESFLECLLRMVLDAALDADGAAPRGTEGRRVLTDAGPRSRDRGRPGEGLRRGVNDGRDHCSSRRDRRERPCRRGPRRPGRPDRLGHGQPGPLHGDLYGRRDPVERADRPDRPGNRARPEPAGGLDRGRGRSAST